jgi:hypothetical protein
MATDEGGNQPQADDEIINMALAEIGQSVEKKEVVQAEPIIDKTDDNEEEAEQKPEESTEDQGDKEAEDKAEEEEEDADESVVSKDVFQKRVDKLTARAKSAEEKAAETAKKLEELERAKAETEAKLNEAAKPVLSPTPDSPLADVNSPDELEQRVQSAHSVRRWALQNSDGATVKNADGTERFVDATEVKQYLIQADDLLTIHVPAKREWLKEYNASHEPVAQVFPQLFQAGTTENKSYLDYLKKRPSFAREPDRDYVYAMALLGEQKWREMQEVEAAKEKAAKKASSVKSEASKTPTPAKPVSSSKTVTKGGGNAAKRVMQGGATRDDLDAMILEELLG